MILFGPLVRLQIYLVKTVFALITIYMVTEKETLERVDDANLSDVVRNLFFWTGFFPLLAQSKIGRFTEFDSLYTQCWTDGA